MRTFHRRAHGLTANASTETPGSILSFDCESVPVDGRRRKNQLHKLRLGVARYVRVEGGKPTRRDLCHFDTPEPFWQFIRAHLSKSRPLILVAHNLLYDFRLVDAFRWLGEQKPLAWKLILGPRPVILSGRWGHYWLHWLDTLNWFQTDLAELGRTLGLRKLPMPDQGAPVERWRRYCARDTEIVESAVLTLHKWWRETDSGVFGKTVAACAWNSWRHAWRVLPDGSLRWTDPATPERASDQVAPPVLIHDDVDTLALERRCHYGGRAECYRTGAIPGRWHLVDVNSMYPAVMASNLYPWKLVRRHVTLSVPQLLDACRTHICAADVMLESPEDCYPVRRNDAIVYPVGTFHTSLIGSELLHALQWGRVLHVGRVAVYERRDLFSDWVRFYYQVKAEARAKGRTAAAKMASQLLQSLYGKFAQWSIGWQHKPRVIAATDWGRFIHYDDDTGEAEDYVAIANHSFKFEQDRESFNAFPAISACICADARQRMRDLRIIAGAPSVVYEHTDALVTDDDGLRRLKMEGELGRNDLGKLKVVATGDDLVVNGIGDYTLGGKRAIAGVMRDAQEVGPATFKQRRSETVWESWGRRGDPTVCWVTETIKLERVYKRRKLRADGTTAPLELWELFDPGFWLSLSLRRRNDGNGDDLSSLL